MKHWRTHLLVLTALLCAVSTVLYVYYSQHEIYESWADMNFVLRGLTMVAAAEFLRDKDKVRASVVAPRLLVRVTCSVLYGFLALIGVLSVAVGLGFPI
jgi:hypothetical protein